MSGPFLWSLIAANNANADPSINWREGQAPSSVNDSARAMMAGLAAFYADISGSLVSSGTSSAYAVATNQGTGGTIPDGFFLSFRAHVTNSTPCTLSVDGSTPAPLRMISGSALPAGLLNGLAVYQVTYVNATSEWLLTSIPSVSSVVTGAMFDYCGASAPTGFVLASGRTIGNATSSATERANADTYALYSLLWPNTNLTVVGGRGASASADYTASKALTLPDLRGRVTVGKDNMGGSAAGVITNFSGTTLFQAGGEQNHALTSAENGPHAHSITDPGHGHDISRTSNTGLTGGPGGTIFGDGSGSKYSADPGKTNISINSSGSGTGHNNIQPSVIVTKIIKL